MEHYITVTCVLTVLTVLCDCKSTTVILSKETKCKKWDPMNVWLDEGELLNIEWNGETLNDCMLQVKAKAGVFKLCMTVIKYKVDNCKTTMTYIDFDPIPQLEVFNCRRIPPKSRCYSTKMAVLINSSFSLASRIELQLIGGEIPVLDLMNEESQIQSADSTSTSIWIVLPILFFLSLAILGSCYWKYKKRDGTENQRMQARRTHIRFSPGRRHLDTNQETVQSVQPHFPLQSHRLTQTESTALSSNPGNHLLEAMPLSAELDLPPSYEEVCILHHEPPPPYPDTVVGNVQ